MELELGIPHLDSLLDKLIPIDFKALWLLELLCQTTFILRSPSRYVAPSFSPWKPPQKKMWLEPVGLRAALERKNFHRNWQPQNSPTTILHAKARSWQVPAVATIQFGAMLGKTGEASLTVRKGKSKRTALWTEGTATKSWNLISFESVKGSMRTTWMRCKCYM